MTAFCHTDHQLTPFWKRWHGDCLRPFPLAEVNETLFPTAGVFKGNVHKTSGLSDSLGRNEKCRTKVFQGPPYVMTVKRASIAWDGIQSTVKKHYNVHFSKYLGHQKWKSKEDVDDLKTKKCTEWQRLTFVNLPSLHWFSGLSYSWCPELSPLLMYYHLSNSPGQTYSSAIN